MSKIKVTYTPDATPLDPNETNGLIPDYISTQGELNILEQQNIVEATTWAKNESTGEILEASFVLELHRRMLNRVWKWAGQLRRSNKNIGVMKEQISTQLALLLKDTAYWIENKIYTWDEIGARFHHRLVAIHIFANGNGRHARLITNILLEKYNQKPFTWGANANPAPLEVESVIRKAYISALKSADHGDYEELIRFVRS